MAQGKRSLKPFVLVNAQAVAGVSSFSSNGVSTELFDRATLEIFVPGTLTGTVIVEGSSTNSNQYLSPALPVTWYTIPLSLNALSGVGDTYIVDFTETAIPWLRVTINSTGGAGTMSVVVTGKES